MVMVGICKAEMIAHDSSGMNTSTFTVLALAAALALPAVAQSPAAPAMAGKTLDGKAFQLSSLKGKVVLVMFWSTGCAVCRDKMPELRQNYEGWSGKPFEMVLVSTDRKMQDVEDYERIISRTVPVKQRFVQLWAGGPGYADNLGKPGQLPATYVIDKAGKVVERYQGRVPPEAWDKIADLL
jgi:peroxiredoxin